MAGNPDPVTSISGIATRDDVSKADFMAFEKGNVRGFAASEVPNYDLSGRGALVVDGAIFVKDVGDTITPAGATVVFDANGVRFKRATTGIGKRVSVRAATTANITISTALNNGDSLDGLTLATGDLVLVKGQMNRAQNGIYVVGTTPARYSGFATYNDYAGALVAIAAGTANANTLWFCSANEGGTLGTTDIVFTKLTFASPTLSDSLPLQAGTAAAGSSAQAARGDHRHPRDFGLAPYAWAPDVVVEAMTVQPSAARAALIKRTVRSLIVAGLWDKLDLLYVLAAHDEQASRVNWINPTNSTLTAVNSPVFDIDRGWSHQNNVDSYLDAGATWDGLTKFQRDSAHMGAWTNSGSSTSNNQYVIGQLNPGTNNRLRPRGSSLAIGYSLNSARTISSNTIAAPLGHAIASRSSSTQVATYKDGVPAGSATDSSDPPVADNIVLLKNATLFTHNYRLAAAHIGGDLFDNDVAALNAILSEYLTAIGAQ